MRFGLSTVNAGPYANPAAAIEFVQAAEQLGFDSIWPTEHIVVPAGYESTYPYSSTGRMAGGVDDFDIPDAFTWLAFVAARTSSILLATGVTILPLRNPLILAKTAATMAVLSGDRFILGVGAGWLQEEFDALGIPFADRGDRTDDAIRAMRALWSQDLATHHGSHFDFDEVYLRPRPPSGSVPIVVGGHSRRAARRAGELGDGLYLGRGRPEEVAPLIARTRETAEAAGRDPASIEITVSSPPDPERIEALADLGVHRVLTFLLGVDALEAFADEIMDAF